MPLPAALQEAFRSGSLKRIREVLATVSTTELFQDVDAVRYTTAGIEFQPNGLHISAPAADEVVILTTSVSLCGTDLGLIEKAKAGELPAEAVGKVVGHEAAGFIVAVGSEVKDWQPGQFVCLDSHFACGRPGHDSFEDCVNAGAGCDGIVGGIRGSMPEDGHREPVKDGYWSRLIVAPASSLPVELPLEIAEHLTAPSTLESLGNIYMMIGQIEHAGLLSEAADTLCIVSGLGATGFPMAAVSHHYGFEVVGVEVVEGKRQLALDREVCQHTYATIDEVTPLLAGKKHVVIAITADQPVAHEQALKWLDSIAGQVDRRVAIIFGLFADPQLPLPTAPGELATMPQRDFVFSRQHYTSEAGTEVYGVCGRDLPAWRKIMQDLMPVDGQPPTLVTQLNSAVYTLPEADPLQQIATELQQGAAHVNGILKEHLAMKLAANLVVSRT